jgi:hypothetical protein
MKRALALLAMTLAACGSDEGSDPDATPAAVEAPALAPLVAGGLNTFQVQPVPPVQNGTYFYSWFCQAPQANINVGGITEGTVRLVIRDDDGAIVHDNVYCGGLAGVISAMSAPGGTPGIWRLEFEFTNFSSTGAIALDADLHDLPDDIVIAGAYELQSGYEYEAGWAEGTAHVALTSTLSLGTVRIRVWDGHGLLVLDRTNDAILVGSTDGESNTGAAGTWRIRIDIDAVATTGAITIDGPYPTGTTSDAIPK